MTLTRITPEGYDIANAYLQLGSSAEVSRTTGIPEHIVVETLGRKDVKAYLNGVYLDLGYRNRNKLGALLDKIIDSKLQEAEETGIYTSKDLILTFIIFFGKKEIGINAMQKETSQKKQNIFQALLLG